MDHALHPVQVAAYRRMTPAEKLEIAARLWYEARALKAAALRARHPSWTDERIEREVRDVFLRAGG